MKSRELKKEIENFYKDLTVDSFPKISVTDFDFDSTSKPPSKSWKYWITLPVTGLIVGIVFTSLWLSGLSPSLPNSTDSVFATGDLNFGFQSFTSTRLISEQMNTNASTKKTQISLLSDDDGPLVEEKLPELKEYLLILEEYLNQNSSEIVIEPSDRDDYQFKMNVSIVDYNSVSQTYTYYYNEYEYQSNQSLIFSDAYDDLQINYWMEGLAIIDNQSIQLEGVMGEDDDESVIMLIAYEDPANYLISSFETDTADNEKKFIYEEYQNNILVQTTKIKTELENEESQVELEIERGSIEAEFSFISSQLKEPYFLIDYELESNTQEETGQIRAELITGSDGQSKYQFIVIYSQREYEYEYDLEDDHSSSSPSNSQPIQAIT